MKLFAIGLDIEKIIDALHAHYNGNEVFTESESEDDADIVFSDRADYRSRRPVALLTSGKENEAYFALQRLLEQGILLPLPEVVGRISELVSDFTANWERLIRKNPVPYSVPGRTLDYAGDVRASVWALFHDDVKHLLPELYRRLAQREKRIARNRGEYFPLVTRVPKEDSVYGHLIVDSSSHTARIDEMRDEFAALGVNLSPANLAYSQLGIGLPFFGGFNRKVQNLKAPTERFKKLALRTSRFMVAGLRNVIASGMDPDDLTTRATVKVDSFQGAPTLTGNHLALQAIWRYMGTHPKGIFAFDDVTFPTVIGFRLSDPGAGPPAPNGEPTSKRRKSFILEETGKVGRDRVWDGDDFEGDVIWGARVRHVDNPSAIQNNALLPIVSYISDYKGDAYKLLYQQDEHLFRVRCPGTIEHEAWWTEAWESGTEWIRKGAARLGISSARELIDHLIEVGDYPVAGDVENFDGNTTFEVAAPFFETLLSDKAYALLERQWNAPAIGVYLDSKEQPVWYIIDRTDKETAKLSDHFPSGNSLTSVGGRGIMTAVLAEIDSDAFGEDLIDRAFDGSDDPYQPFLYSCVEGGDDHVRVWASYYLLTGIKPKELRDKYLKAQSEYKMYSISPEEPKMACGFLLSCDDEGKLLSVSLSEKRCASNTLFPEYAKTAIGLYHSTQRYAELAQGTVVEDVTNRVVDKIIHDVYGFTDELLAVSVAEDEQQIASEALRGGDAHAAIAALLGINPSQLDYAYAYEDLVELGVPEELLENWRQPIPSELTRNPFNFFNQEILK